MRHGATDAATLPTFVAVAAGDAFAALRQSMTRVVIGSAAVYAAIAASITVLAA